MPASWSNAARQDLARIFDFNTAYNPQRATVIDHRLAVEAERCADRPPTGRPIAGTSIRKRSITGLQYVIRYRVDDGTVTIIGIRHTRENREPR